MLLAAQHNPIRNPLPTTHRTITREQVSHHGITLTPTFETTGAATAPHPLLDVTVAITVKTTNRCRSEKDANHVDQAARDLPPTHPLTAHANTKPL